jgi:ParB/RepB/Spo0J family partition protein
MKMDNFPVEKWKVNKLFPHRLQETHYGKHLDQPVDDLAADLKRNGQRVPLEILPDGAVICGRRRLEAARKLGWDSLEVIVRHELAEQGEKAIEYRLLEDDLTRRQLHPLDQAGHLLRLKQLTTRKGQLSGAEKESLRDQLGKRLGMSGRNLDRYFQILRAPFAVQQAFRRGRISLVLAARVAMFPIKIQQDIAQQIEAGEDPRKVIDAGERTTLTPKGEAARAYDFVLRAIKSALPVLDGKASKLDLLGHMSPHRQSILSRGMGLLKQLLELELALHRRYLESEDD